MAKYTSYERETIISFNEEEPTASVYTFNRKLRNKLSQAAKEGLDCQVVKETEDYSEFIVPKKWVDKVTLPRKTSEETKIKQKERGKMLAATRWGDKS